MIEKVFIITDKFDNRVLLTIEELREIHKDLDKLFGTSRPVNPIPPDHSEVNTFTPPPVV